MKSKKKILFRADGTTKSGLGHLYRLFSIVEMIKDYYDYIFVTKSDSILESIPNWINYEIFDNNLNITMELDYLNTNFPSSKYILIADGYQFSSEYQKKVLDFGYKMIYIDDLATEKMYADIVVNHSPGLHIKNFKYKKNTKFALGTKYAMLRSLFLNEILQARRKIEKIKSILICFGGTDLKNISSKMLQFIIPFQQITEINVIIGAGYKHTDIFDLKKQDNRIKILSNLSEFDMLAVMKRCQMAILPASTILYEASAVGMMIIGGYYVDNQLSIYHGFKENNLLYGIGDYNRADDNNITDAINEVLEFSKKDFEFYLKNQRKMFDGKQKERFLNLINEIV